MPKKVVFSVVPQVETPARKAFLQAKGKWTMGGKKVTEAIEDKDAFNKFYHALGVDFGEAVTKIFGKTKSVKSGDNDFTFAITWKYNNKNCAAKVKVYVYYTYDSDREEWHVNLQKFDSFLAM